MVIWTKKLIATKLHELNKAFNIIIKQSYLVVFYCRNERASENSRVAKPNQVKSILLSKLATTDSKKSRFIKVREAREVLSSLEIRTCLNQVPNVPWSSTCFKGS